ncbi:MAG: GGDEF domain-containing protein [Lachnospiraceae bacterium]|nr:GGDEF domain-containing protein [Lachnospiraceae bacterium]
MSTSKYLTALESAICKLYQLPTPDSKQICEAMAELCYVLRLGKVEVIIYENEAAEHSGLSEIHSFYDSGKTCKSVGISKRITVVDEKVIVYNIYPMEGEEEWTEEERNRINVFIAVLSTYSGKSRLVNLAHHLTFYDSDFNMYNLRQFMKCAQILCRAGRIDQFTAVRFNLKHFSVVNQNIGRERGTLVMKKFVGFINDLLDDKDELICRVGGDNFLTLIKSDKLQSVLDVLSGTGVVYDEIQDERIFISATVGVYVIKDIDRGAPPTDIMDRVSLAYHIAKNISQTDIVYFNNDLLARSKHNNEISASFPKALEEREFLVYYQPKVAIDGRHIAGAEALCRWMHNGRMVSPGEFIPILEQGLDICKLDFYMLDAVCKDIRRWLDSGMNIVRISVNLSRRHLTDIDLLKHIIEIVDRNNVPHKYIEIELTETTTDVEFKDLKRTIGGLQQAGFSTSVDDFGIGYSSLNLIKEMPWNVLKLDKSLLPDEGDESPIQNGVMFKYIVAMAREMGLECIAEGVETIEQVRLLADNNCNLAQGFYFDKPLPVEEFETRLEKSYVYDR